MKNQQTYIQILPKHEAEESNYGNNPGSEIGTGILHSVDPIGSYKASEKIPPTLMKKTPSPVPAPYHRPSDLLKFNPSKDPTELLGNRWLCRGGSCLWVGPSGGGKSVLAIQNAVKLAAGLPLFGIKTRRPLKSLIIQAENDDGDMAEALQGVIKGVGAKIRRKLKSHIEQNIVFVRETVVSGSAFAKFAEQQIDFHKPDIVWIDPLLSYLGADACNQQAVSYFLRHQLHPISQRTGIIWMIMHHTGKPDKDSTARSSWTTGDFAYAGLGTSEMTNWARAVCVLRTSKAEDGSTNYTLVLAKRSRRAGATHPDGTPTTAIHLKQSDHGICWEQVDPPEPEVKTPKEEVMLKGIPSPVKSNVLCAELRKRFRLKVGAAKMRISRMVDSKVLIRTKDGYTHAFGSASEPNQATLPI